jgi:hypothetical protein
MDAGLLDRAVPTSSSCARSPHNEITQQTPHEVAVIFSDNCSNAMVFDVIWKDIVFGRPVPEILDSLAATGNEIGQRSRLRRNLEASSERLGPFLDRRSEERRSDGDDPPNVGDPSLVVCVTVIHRRPSDQTAHRVANQDDFVHFYRPLLDHIVEQQRNIGRRGRDGKTRVVTNPDNRGTVAKRRRDGFPATFGLAQTVDQDEETLFWVKEPGTQTIGGREHHHSRRIADGCLRPHRSCRVVTPECVRDSSRRVHASTIGNTATIDDPRNSTPTEPHQSVHARGTRAMRPMKSVASRTYEGEPWPHDCVMHALDNVDHPMCGQSNKMPGACVRPDGVIFGSHKIQARW